MNTRAKVVCLVFFTLILGMSAHAQPFGGKSEKHWEIVSTADLQALKESGTLFVLINVLPKIIHDNMHIRGSVNIPLGTVADSQDLPDDKNTVLVFYCMGKQCRYSPKAANIVLEKGYGNVFVYRDGLLGWRRAGLPVESLINYPKVEIPQISAAELADDNEVWFLDLRPADHFARGHIKGSTNIDLEVLDKKTHLLPKDRRILLIDHKGKLTLTTGRFLAAHGIRNVGRLDGGINGWVKSDLPLETNSSSIPTLPSTVAETF